MHQTTPASGRTTRALRTVLALAAVTALALAACTGGGASPSVAPATEPAAEAAPFEGTLWQLAEYATEGGAAVPVPEAVAATATFADGTVSGNGGCNSYRASYTLDGESITIGEVAGTLIACEGPAGTVETAFFTAFPKMTNVAVTGDVLELTGDGGKLILRFTAVEPAGLTGTTWSATSINNGNDGVESVATGTTVTAVFTEDGNVTGNSGCNTFNGTYTVDGAAISFGPLMSTKMACEQPAMDQEAAFLAALGNASTYAISGDKLELRDADGALQVGFAATTP